MDNVQKKDIFLVGFCFFILILAFLGLYFKDDLFDKKVVEQEEEQQEEIFTYTPVDEENIGEICPKVFVDQRDGQEYSVVQIGAQCWMAENLNYEHDDALCYDSRNIYGCYYNWSVANEVCPSGWKLASDDEWKILEIQLGMSPQEANKIDGYRYTFVENGEVGGMLKSDRYWLEPNECFGECNTSGFNALPSGNAGEDGPETGEKVFFWTSSEAKGIDFEGVVTRRMDNQGAGISRERTGADHGYSVRCLMVRS